MILWYWFEIKDMVNNIERTTIHNWKTLLNLSCSIILKYGELKLISSNFFWHISKTIFFLFITSTIIKNIPHITKEVNNNSAPLKIILWAAKVPLTIAKKRKDIIIPHKILKIYLLYENLIKIKSRTGGKRNFIPLINSWK